MREKKILAWHFIGADRRLAHDGSDLTVEPGYIYSIGDDEIVKPCRVGLHASISAFDALQYATGPVICRVRLWGDLQHHDNDKIAARHREVLAVADVARQLRLFACFCVRSTPIGNGKTAWDLLTDERSRNAVIVAERFANDEATAEESEAARGSAWGAAMGSARGAAWGAAREAARDFQRNQFERMMLEAIR